MAKIITGNIELYNKICLCLGVDPTTVRHLVLDFSIDKPLTAYLELCGDERFLTIDWDIPDIEINLNYPSPL